MQKEASLLSPSRKMTALSYSLTTCMIRHDEELCWMMVPLRNWWHLEAEPDADREGDDEDEVGKRDDYLRIIFWNFDVMLILKRSDVVVFLQNRWPLQSCYHPPHGLADHLAPSQCHRGSDGQALWPSLEMLQCGYRTKISSSTLMFEKSSCRLFGWNAPKKEENVLEETERPEWSPGIPRRTLGDNLTTEAETQVNVTPGKIESHFILIYL